MQGAASRIASRGHIGARAKSPDLEGVDGSPESSFKVWAHGFPFRTVGWHFHPEYEIHLVAETRGRSMADSLESIKVPLQPDA